MGLLSVPLKTILPYHADLQNEAIPESYAVCNGQTLSSVQQDINPGSTYTLPDLRNVFLLGGDITKAASNAGDTSNAAAGAPGPKGTGGAHSKSLVVAELASHTHSGTIGTAGTHTHPGSTTAVGGAHGHTGNTTTAGAHTHDGSSLSTTGTHSHAGSSTSVQGQHAHSIIDPGHSHTITGGVNPNAPGGSVPLGSSTSGFSGYPTLFTVHGTDSATTGTTISINGDHTHNLTITSDGSHTHTLTIASDGSHTHPVTINSGGDHSHSFSLIPDGDHTHAFTGGSAGSGQAWDTRPRFYGVIYIMKVKI